MLNRLDQIKQRYEQITEDLADPKIFSDQERYRQLAKEERSLAKIVKKSEQYRSVLKNIEEDLNIVKESSDRELREIAQAELEELETYIEDQLAGIPPEERFLVTNHDSLGYLAHEYDLKVLGSVVPAASTMAEPSASDLTELIEGMGEHSICTVFTEATASEKLAQTVAAELDGCDSVRVLKLYTGAVGPAGSGADSYLGMMRYNIDTIVDGLK